MTVRLSIFQQDLNSEERWRYIHSCSTILQSLKKLKLDGAVLNSSYLFYLLADLNILNHDH